MRVESFLSDAVGEYQDRGRDDIPPNYAWSLRDLVPHILGATLRVRGHTTYNSQALPGAVESLVWAPYAAGGRLVAVTDTQAYDVPPAGTTATLIGSVPGPVRANALFYRNALYVPSPGSAIHKIGYSPFGIATLPGSAPQGAQLTSYRDRLVGSDATGTSLVFSKPGDPTAAWDSLSVIAVEAFISGLKAMRNQILVFHYDSVEFIRGTTPPDSTLSDQTGDMTRDILWSDRGCFDARSISSWQENVIFADASGVHITDGGQVRNMIEQGGMSRAWRSAFEEALVAGVNGTVYGNYYLCTVRVGGGSETWLCDIPTRRWHRWSNIESAAFAVSTVGASSERLHATDHTTRRVLNLDYCLNPDKAGEAPKVDANGVNVLPVIETPWLRISRRVGLRRIYDVFLYYLARRATDPGTDMVSIGYVTEPEDTTYEALTGFRQTAVSKRRKVPVFRELEGIAFRVAATQQIIDFRIHNVGLSLEAEEEHRVA